MTKTQLAKQLAELAARVEELERKDREALERKRDLVLKLIGLIR